MKSVSKKSFSASSKHWQLSIYQQALEAINYVIFKPNTLDSLKRKILKVVAINSGFFIFFLLLIELGSYLALLRADRKNINFLFAPKPAEVDNPCIRMRTHPFLGHAHDHQNNCDDIVGGSSDGPFVVYDSPRETNDIIITLGGSTTDGFDTYHSEGITWSSALNEILINKGINL